MGKDFKVIGIISGRGSNLKSMLEGCKDCTFTAVFSNKPEAGGLDFARQQDIPTLTFARSDYESVTAQKTALFEKAIELEPDLIVLAGYMQIVPPEITKKLFGKMINIHPSLLPLHKGLDTHKRALESGDKEHGCSVHFVTPELDEGPVIAQAKVPVLEGDTEESLSERVLVEEHKIYPWVVNMLAAGDITFDGTSVNFSQNAADSARNLELSLPL